MILQLQTLSALREAFSLHLSPSVMRLIIQDVGLKLHAVPEGNTPEASWDAALRYAMSQGQEALTQFIQEAGRRAPVTLALVGDALSELQAEGAPAPSSMAPTGGSPAPPERAHPEDAADASRSDASTSHRQQESLGPEARALMDLWAEVKALTAPSGQSDLLAQNLSAYLRDGGALPAHGGDLLADIQAHFRTLYRLDRWADFDRVYGRTLSPGHRAALALGLPERGDPSRTLHLLTLASTAGEDVSILLPPDPGEPSSDTCVDALLVALNGGSVGPLDAHLRAILGDAREGDAAPPPALPLARSRGADPWAPLEGAHILSLDAERRLLEVKMPISAPGGARSPRPGRIFFSEGSRGAEVILSFSLRRDGHGLRPALERGRRGRWKTAAAMTSALSATGMRGSRSPTTGP